MRPASTIKTLSILFVIFFIAIGALALRERQKKSEEKSSIASNENEYVLPMSITGISSTDFEGDTIKSRISAEKLDIRPRKYSIFKIKPFNELYIQNLTIELYLAGNQKVEKPSLASLFFSNSAQEIKNLNMANVKKGLITRGVIDNLDLKIYKDGALCYSVKTKKASINLSNSEVTLRKASIHETASNRFILSDMVIWDHKNDILKIPANYTVIIDDREVTKGKNTIIEY